MKAITKRALSHLGYEVRRLRPAGAPPLPDLSQRLFATHHPIFRRFRPWSGRVPPGFRHTCVGSLIRTAFFAGYKGNEGGYIANGTCPPVNEEYFEWVDLLEAMADAEHRFVIAELGAGYGRWCVAAACTARHNRPDLAVRLIAIEAEPNHFEMLKQHFDDNGIPLGDHRMLQAAVNGGGGEVSFPVGHSTEWWGQAIIPSGVQIERWPEAQEIRVPAMRLEEILDQEARVDLVDMDIQGAEGEVIVGSVSVLNEKVRRLHIGTHSPFVENQIHGALTAEGWHCSHAFPCGSTVETHYGIVKFQDGIQSWLNPRLF